ncbi:MAG: UDP-N-acetylmuramoyl-tripeptide-D-alanyl-D-alanine ligase [Candidatus Kaiserbacteria bacterium GW2011_GWC2_52_8b]|uniref:UDP-N-acetylmuramoyl-tripeptide-D-alanyl-D-alanine ligase n=2 Tax=Candidatus Kaiseribacteriota TaxID=1752734 RepID=A0A0G1XJB2_9BACT|nr:MAG: UDP-N-acetylmuramoyl-tripeptide-D-alanyl-D-alanine ligase [Candidatus Kaiserbacteria bacterium GW2011_GWA2_52_12]KKW30995.1 MAG: UDP-N-acetylmuramoyl-tripeptide-D-alanyl-D-alanine ligase [Candidatus Kaiserbacteria bacterium GW2011_GWC2_52_8b]
MCEARLVLWRYAPRIIVITGSVGKTTTKDAIYSVLADHVHVRKSEKSMNSEIGVPLTILGQGNAWKNPFKWFVNIVRGILLLIIPQKYPGWLVLEVGADRPGDISSLARWLRPDIAVMTGVPEIPVHVEYFHSTEDVAHEKLSLLRYVRPGGTVILNGDDVRLEGMKKDIKEKCLTYGIEGFNDFFATGASISYEKGMPTGMKFEMHHGGVSEPATLYGALGTPRVYSALAAVAVGKIVGVGQAAAARSLGASVPSPGRMRTLDGTRNSIIIDDTYNSSPAAALSALDTMREIKKMPPGQGKPKRKIAILADMLELGKYSAEAHKLVGARAATCLDLLITVGFRARGIAQAALDAGMPDGNIRQYEQNEAVRAGNELESELQKGDIVLVKGSQSMRMERAVEEIMAEPMHASSLLVRQDDEWLKKA